MLISSSSAFKIVNIFYIILIFLKITHGGTYATNTFNSYSDEVQKYLMQFGYLPESDPQIANLRTDEQYKSAIKTMQQFFNLTQSGEIDIKTLKVMQKPRCGQPDILLSNVNRFKRFAVGLSKWNHTNLTWSLVNHTMAHSGSARRSLTEAFDVWQRGSPFTFQEQYSETADIQIKFVRGYHGDTRPFDGPGMVLAHAFYPMSGVVHFDDDEPWDFRASPNDVNSVSLKDVATHEFGHTLGLPHVNNKDSIMYELFNRRPIIDLPYIDRLALYKLYGLKCCPNSFIPSKNIPKTATSTTTSTTTRARKPNTTKKTKNPFKTTQKPKYNPTQKPLVPNNRDRKQHHQHKIEKPDKCNTSYDAITLIRGELFMFKDRYFWRLNEDKSLHEGCPYEITAMFPDLSGNFTKIDAVYENSQSKIIFFIGKLYYVFNENNLKLEDGYPKPFTNLGLPDYLNEIDAVFVWGKNKQTYIFSGTQYWRFDEELKKVKLDYPRDMNIWRGIGYHIDAAFQWIDASVSLKEAAVHEFGHTLGIGHSSNPTAIMYPTFYNRQIQDLPEDDRLAIFELYGSLKKQWGYNPHYKPPIRIPQTTTTTTTRKPFPTRTYYPDKKVYYPFKATQKPDLYPKYNRTRPTQQPPRVIPNHHGREEHHQQHYPYHHHHHHQQKRIKTEKPDKCNTSYDAITVIRRELFIFKDRYLWRLDEHKRLQEGCPYEITSMFPELPRNFSKIDAVYENSQAQIIFFIGKLYYVFNGNILVRGYPKPITNLGLPDYLNRIDTVFVWGHHNRTFIFSGTQYWKFDDEIKKVELDYPRDMSIWRGIGYHIDAAFQWRDGKSYFFKGKGFWKFDDSLMRVAHNRPTSSALFWMSCPRTHEDFEEDFLPTVKSPLVSNSGHSHNKFYNKFLVFTTIIVYIIKRDLLI